MNDPRKSDERILGDGGFVESALADARETIERKYRLRNQGQDLAVVLTRISRILSITEARIKPSGKEPERVRAKSIAAYWAVKELGLAGTEVGKALNLTQSAFSRAVRRGEVIVKELGISLIDEGNA
ncbi:MAG: hypothetical protein ACP5SH_06110 [Syntrophobacteraceae bacterium]